MQDVEIVAWKPVITERGMKKIKVRVKYYIEDEIAIDFKRVAESNNMHYTTRDEFKLYILLALLKENKEGADIIRKAIKELGIMKAFFEMYLESVVVKD